MSRLATATLVALVGAGIACTLVPAIPAHAGAIPPDPQSFQAFVHENDAAMDPSQGWSPDISTDIGPWPATG